MILVHNLSYFQVQQAASTVSYLFNSQHCYLQCISQELVETKLEMLLHSVGSKWMYWYTHKPVCTAVGQVKFLNCVSYITHTTAQCAASSVQLVNIQRFLFWRGGDLQDKEVLHPLSLLLINMNSSNQVIKVLAVRVDTGLQWFSSCTWSGPGLAAELSRQLCSLVPGLHARTLTSCCARTLVLAGWIMRVFYVLAK